jgi:hypothetical protein
VLAHTKQMGLVPINVTSDQFQVECDANKAIELLVELRHRFPIGYYDGWSERMENP